jgi:hypothetical protein
MGVPNSHKCSHNHGSSRKWAILTVSLRVLRFTDITRTESEFLRQKLSPSVCAEPFEACLSEVVGVNWVDGAFGCGDHLEDLKSLQTRLIRIFRKLCCRARWNSPARREIFLRSRCLSHRLDMRRSVLLRKLVNTLIHAKPGDLEQLR